MKKELLLLVACTLTLVSSNVSAATLPDMGYTYWAYESDESAEEMKDAFWQAFLNVYGAQSGGSTGIYGPYSDFGFGTEKCMLTLMTMAPNLSVLLDVEVTVNGHQVTTSSASEALTNQELPQSCYDYLFWLWCELPEEMFGPEYPPDVVCPDP